MEHCFSNKPSWDPEFWDNLNEKDLLITNCYSYAFNIIEKNNEPDSNKHKLQPGELSNSKLSNYSCDTIIKNIENDYNITLNSVGLYDILPCNHYRIAIVIDNEGEYKDYHFYRQDDDGFYK